MAQRKQKILKGETYVVYNKGVFGHDLFHDKEDYERFASIMYLANSDKSFKVKDIKKYQRDMYKVNTGKKLVEIYGYVLVPNQFHIILSPISNLSATQYMQKVCTAYSMYYNRKYKRSGSLFEGRFRSNYIYNDKHLKHMFALINLMPLKLLQNDWMEIGISDEKKARQFLEGYDYSTFIDYFVGDRAKTKIINKEAFMKKIEDGDDLQKDILEWLGYGKELSSAY
jgi:REP element-mobilizing transposase RayT